MAKDCQGNVSRDLKNFFYQPRVCTMTIDQSLLIERKSLDDRRSVEKSNFQIKPSRIETLPGGIAKIYKMTMEVFLIKM